MLNRRDSHTHTRVYSKQASLVQTMLRVFEAVTERLLFMLLISIHIVCISHREWDIFKCMNGLERLRNPSDKK